MSRTNEALGSCSEVLSGLPRCGYNFEERIIRVYLRLARGLDLEFLHFFAIISLRLVVGLKFLKKKNVFVETGFSNFS